MTTMSDLLALGDIIVPKAEKPNLVENIEVAITDPVRTLQDYLFTSGIRGHFERIFRDVREGRGGGYWIQAEYGGGKTHFLASLLCLASLQPDKTLAEIWERVSDDDMRGEWMPVVAQRRFLGAHLSLMGTTAAVGGEQPRLVDLIDAAIANALKRHAVADPGLSAGEEVINWFKNLDPAIRASLETSFRGTTGQSVEEHLREYSAPNRTAQALLAAANSLSLRPDVHVDVRRHYERVLSQLRELNFDGLVIVVDEYFSRQVALSDQQTVQDGELIETLGFVLGREQRLPVYLLVASQSEIPAKLAERLDPMVLLRDEDKEYSQIVCKRILDYRDSVQEQAVLYHTTFARSFQFLRNTTPAETREIFPFQRAVFRFLRDLVNSSRLHLPSTRFAIGVAYDAIASPEALQAKRFITRSDLLIGGLERELLNAPETKEGATALRQAREFIDSSEWQVPYFHTAAHRLVNHLFLDAVTGGQGQNVDQIVEGTLVQDEKGMLPAKQIVLTVLKQLGSCDQIDSRGETWRFVTRVAEGQQFQTIFQARRRVITRNDPRIDAKWSELLTANVSVTGGVPTFLQSVVARMSLPVEYSGLQFAAEALSSSVSTLPSRLQPLERLTHNLRARVVVALGGLPGPPNITDSAIAVIAPGSLSEAATDDIRGLLACEEIHEEYRTRADGEAERLVKEAEDKARELTRSIVSKQKENYRDGEIYTQDDLGFNPKQLFRENLQSGIQNIAGQLIRHAYKEAPNILNSAAARRGAMATVDSSKVFDALFGGVTEAKTKGAAEAFGPLLGLSMAREPGRLIANASPGRGPDPIAEFIGAHPGCTMADVYSRFCDEPFGLTPEIVDLLVMACVQFGKPHAIELRAPAGMQLQTRERGEISGSLRPGQLRRIVWPKSLKGFTIAQSSETSWNDFVHIPQSLDPDRYTVTSDQRDIESQERAFQEYLASLEEGVGRTKTALTNIAEALGSTASSESTEALDRLSGLASLRSEYSRETFLAHVETTWGQAGIEGIKQDAQRYASLASLAGEAPSLVGRLSWYRLLVSSRPEALGSEIAMTEPLVTFDALTSAQAPVAKTQLEEIWGKFQARFRTEHQDHIKWVTKQREALDRASNRLKTLERLNRLLQLGPPELPSAEDELRRHGDSLIVCATPDRVNVGNGLSCMSCKYQLGDHRFAEPVGEKAEAMITSGIERRARSLTQGLIVQAIEAAGDKELVAVLAAAQAGQFKTIIDQDLLNDELIKKLAAVLAKARQQTVPSSRLHSYLSEQPYVTPENIEEWLQGLRKILQRSFDEARKANPDKEITLLLSGDRGDEN